MFGKINLENFDGMTKMPQKAATAWAGAFGEPLAGASFKPLLYLGDQLVNGTNYYFIAEETLATRCPTRARCGCSSTTASSLIHARRRTRTFARWAPPWPRGNTA